MGLVSYDIAREYVAILGVTNSDEWHQYIEKTEPFYNGEVLCHPLPHNIPKYPHLHYTNTNEWISWDHFLSISTPSPNDRIGNKRLEIIEVLKSLRLTHHSEWELYKLANNLGIDYYNTQGEYINPLRHVHTSQQLLMENYDIDITDYVRGEKCRKLFSYEKAKLYMNEHHNFSTLFEYFEYVMECRQKQIKPFPDGILLYPVANYSLHKQWTGWDDYLGLPEAHTISPHRMVSKQKIDSKYTSFEKVREFLWTLNFRSPYEYMRWSATGAKKPFYNSLSQFCMPRPICVPAHAPRYFKVRGEWTNWRDFLNLPDKRETGYTVAELAEVAKKHNIKSKKQWVEFSKISEYPRDLKQYFALKNQFFPGFIIMLDNGLKKRMRLEEMKTFLQVKNIKSHKEYKQWYNDNGCPDYMPKTLNYYRRNHPNLNINSLFPQQFMKKLERKQEAITIGVVYISTDKWLPSNMYFITHDLAGRANAISVIKRLERTLIAMYNVDELQMTILNKIISNHCTQYSPNGRNCYIVPNMTNLLNELDLTHIRTDLA